MSRLMKLKTKPWQRQLSLAKTSASIGVGTATQMLPSLFLPSRQRQERNKRIVSKQARYLAKELGKLKGTAVKVGQIMALYGENILPEEITEALRTLEENTQPVDWQVIEGEIRQQLGSRFDEFEIQEEPIGAASLAQVHKAWHKPTQSWLCLKIQYPGMEESIDSDLNSIANLMTLSRLVSKTQDFSVWFDGIRELLHYEIDYQREAALTQAFFSRLANNALLTVPAVYAAYCTNKLIVASFEAGYAVTDEAVQALPLARRNRLALAFLQLFIQEVFDWGELQTDPNFGNYRIQIDEQGNDRLVLLDFGAVLTYSDSFLLPVRDMLMGAITNDLPRIKKGAVNLGIMQMAYPEEVHQDFAVLCQLLVEPFMHQERQMPPDYVNANGHYCWKKSALPKRAAKHAAHSAISQYFAVPPKEFVFLSRKLLGVYSFIAALGAEFNPDHVLDRYL